VIATPGVVFEFDAVFLFVLLGIAAGQGVSWGSGWLHIPGEAGFGSFWRGFWFLILWALVVSVFIYTATPVVVLLMQEHADFVPAANFGALSLASASFGVQVSMRHKAQVPTAFFGAMGIALGLMAHFRLI